MKGVEREQKMHARVLSCRLASDHSKKNRVIKHDYHMGEREAV